MFVRGCHRDVFTITICLDEPVSAEVVKVADYTGSLGLRLCAVKISSNH